MAIKVSEIFHSVQGEGQWAGTPSTFVRLSGCNLRCVWCDTPYASWNPEGEIMELDDIFASAKHRHVVLTGGEPMLFAESVTLSERWRKDNRIITIETAGTIFQDVHCDLMSISPKLSNSTPTSDAKWNKIHEERRWNPEVINKLTKNYPYQLKFVIGPEVTKDINEVEALLSQLDGINPEQVFLMPEGRDSSSLWSRAKELIPACMSHGWRIAPRLQIDLFGDTKGT